MKPVSKNLFARFLLTALVTFPAASGYGCSSCRGMLQSDWETQGLTFGTGLRLDLRYDYINQNQLRSGTGRASWPAGHEQEIYTKSQHLNAALDYSWTPDWGLNLRVPFIDRDHSTFGEAGDGSDAGTSHSRKIGDIKIVGRYQGFLEAKNLGVLFGVKLPTGSSSETFSGGPIAGDRLDRALQAGSGTTDVITGIYYYGELVRDWSYFSDVTTQIPVNSHEDYRPGASLDFTAGIRYTGFQGLTPQIQITPRFAAKDKLNGDADADSGGTTVYLSPGLTVPVSKNVKIYGFVQLPIYQNLNGYQLAPKCIFSVGTRFEF